MATRIPPPVVMLMVALLMWLAADRLPPAPVEYAGRLPLALALAAAGLAVAVAGVLGFRRARTTVNPLRPERASALVTSGIYRWSRNPMYLGDLLLLLGWAAWLGSVPALCLVPAFVLCLNRFQIRAEEGALAARFGETYAAYCRRVRRWL